MLNLAKLRKLDPQIVCLGSYPGIIQAILDFDYMLGRARPSIVAIVAAGRKSERYFYGDQEILVPVYASPGQVPAEKAASVNLFLNLMSGRRVLDLTQQATQAFGHLVGGVIFAEGLPERHALELGGLAQQHKFWLVGGASVGLVVPGVVKVGAIGGIEPGQLEASRLFTPGSVAVISSSGGMVSEIIRTVATSGHALSFGVALGGERFPILSPEEAFLAAQADPATQTIVYFGELGGQDEYRLADLVKQGRITKPVIAYIGGTVADLFETPPQFGHAKAMAARQEESAVAKTAALRAVGVNATKSYGDFVAAIKALPSTVEVKSGHIAAATLANRHHRLIASSVSYDEGGAVKVLHQDLVGLAAKKSFAHIAVSMFLGRSIRSKELEQFVDFVLRLLVDHGPYVSGAVNTIVAARAGRDLVSSLAAGLLTIGPRFGGAINQAAVLWLEGATAAGSASEFVEALAARHERISGIGHRKYRADMPDPRVAQILAFSARLKQRRFTSFALAVEAETTQKKANLILNVDGAIAAVLLDFLAEKEHFTVQELRDLTDAEFFNALFVLSRSVGFMAHYFDQARLDEGLFRLGDEHVAPLKPLD